MAHQHITCTSIQVITKHNTVIYRKYSTHLILWYTSKYFFLLVLYLTIVGKNLSNKCFKHVD